jgi:putative ABC transport system ATP-binding protein
MNQNVTLESQALTKTYFSTEPPTEVLRGIDLSVRAGEFLAIMGASGSGKSTLLYSISGMDRPTDGKVLLEGRELTSLSDAEMSNVRLTRMGFVFQRAHFLGNLDVRDNILLPALKAVSKENKDAAIARADALMERFGASRTSRTTASHRSQAASCSGPPSAGRWRASRPSCSRTSRRAR